MALLKRNSDKIALLRKVPIFANLSKKEIEAVARVAEEVDYAKGEFVGHQGAPGDAAYVVIAGSVKVRRNGRKVASLGPGEVAGEMSIIDGQPRSADLVAEEPSSLLLIHRRDFGGMMDESIRLQRKVLLVLAERLREADRALYG